MENEPQKKMKRTLKTSDKTPNTTSGRKNLFRSAIENSPSGFALLKAISDQNANMDYLIFVEVNQSFAKMIKKDISEIIGSKVGDLLPFMKRTKENWVSYINQVLRNQKNLEFRHFYEDKWFKTTIFSPSRDHIIIEMQDTTEEMNQLIKYENFFLLNLDLLCIGDRKGRLLQINREWSVVLGYTMEELESMNVFQLIHPSDRAKILDQLNHLDINSEILHFTAQFTRKDGNYRYIECKCHLQGEFVYVAARDITEHKEREEALRISESKYRLLAEATSDAIWVYNLSRDQFTYVSPSMQTLRGFSVDETLLQRLQDMVAPEAYPMLKDALNNIMDEFLKDPSKATGAMIETQLVCKNGSAIWSEISARLRYNHNGEIEIVGISRNIEKRKNYENEVLYLSYHDQLTGLYNRRFYEEELIRINNELNYPITLVMADVNGLKLTNDAFGHVFGDRLLITFANVLKKECRVDDICARIGGDEFVILLPRTNAIQAEKIVDRIQECLKNIKVENVNLSVSFGWKTKFKVSEEFDEIYKQAEDAMYRRKLLVGKSYKSDTLKLITKSLYEKSSSEQLHCERVSTYCKCIGLAMGMDSDDIDELGLIGLVHDIGKVGINAEILNRKGPLSDEEWEDMRRHPEIGYHILRSVNEFAEIAEYVLAHHERIDGKGYPNGLSESDIPQKSKILHIAEAFEAMTGVYPYHEKYSVTEAIEELRRNAGTQFDDVILHIFIEKVLSVEHTL